MSYPLFAISLPLFTPCYPLFTISHPLFTPCYPLFTISHLLSTLCYPSFNRYSQLFFMPYPLFSRSSWNFDVFISLLAMYAPLPAISNLLVRISHYSTPDIDSTQGSDFDPCKTLLLFRFSCQSLSRNTQSIVWRQRINSCNSRTSN